MANESKMLKTFPFFSKYPTINNDIYLSIIILFSIRSFKRTSQQMSFNVFNRSNTN